MRPDCFSHSKTRLCYDAARLIAIYTVLNKATEVYACDVPEPLTQPLGIAAAVAFEWILVRYLYGPPSVGHALAQWRYLSF